MKSLSKNSKIKPELIAPCGDWPSLVTAVACGADSVYFGVKDLNMRHEAANFTISEMKKIMKFLRHHKRKGYLTVNTIVLNPDLIKLKKILTKAKEAKVSGVILWDMAVFSLAKKLGLKVHLSTQASVSNCKALEFFTSLGVRRIVLARECSLVDIKQITNYIKKHKLKCEIEAFIHGAMCLSVSGRCFLSLYSWGRSANQGKCIQPCRRMYHLTDATGEAEYLAGDDYVLSPKDLCTIDFLDKLIKSGIKAFKIEGRRRPAEYVGVVVSVYRKAIDAYFSGKLTSHLKKELKKELACVFNRGFSSGFYFKPPKEYSRKLYHTRKKIYLGDVVKFYPNISVAEIMLYNRDLNKGDTLLFSGKTTPASSCEVDQLQQNKIFVESVAKGQRAAVKLPFKVRPKDKVFLWIKS